MRRASPKPKRQARAGRPAVKSALKRAVPLRTVREELLRNREVRLNYDELRIREAVGQVLQSARKRLGLTQTQVAEAAGTTQPVIARIEAGHGTVPTFRLLDRIARAVGLRLTLALKADRAA